MDLKIGVLKLSIQWTTLSSPIYMNRGMNGVDD